MNTGSTDQKDLFTVSDATLFFFWGGGGGEGGKHNQNYSKWMGQMEKHMENSSSEVVMNRKLKFLGK